MEYKSKAGFLGLPLVHVSTSRKDNGVLKRGVARGWIAVGDISFGPFLSLGGISFGGIALGGLSMGILSIGGLALGFFSIGGMAIGIFLAVGGVAAAYYAAYGGAAAAVKYALGGAAFAREANTLAAREILAGKQFFEVSNWILRHSRWGLLLLIIPVILRFGKKCRQPGRT